MQVLRHQTRPKAQDCARTILNRARRALYSRVVCYLALRSTHRRGRVREIGCESELEKLSQKNLGDSPPRGPRLSPVERRSSHRRLCQISLGASPAVTRARPRGRAPGPRDRAFACQRPREPAPGAARRSARGRRLHALLRSVPPQLFTLLCRYFPAQEPRHRVNGPVFGHPPLCALRIATHSIFTCLASELGRLVAEPSRGPNARSTRGPHTPPARMLARRRRRREGAVVLS